MSRRNLVILSGSSHPELARQIAEILDVQLLLPETQGKPGHNKSPVQQSVQFSNENIMVTIPRNVRDCDCFVVQTQAPPVSDNIIQMCLTMEALRESDARKIIAVTPYLPYVRSDQQDRPRRAIGLKWIAKVLKASEMDKILLVDPHCGKSINAYFDTGDVDVMRAKPVFVQYILDHVDLANAVMVAPDLGSSKRIASMATMLKLLVAIIDKRRLDDSETVSSMSTMIGDVKGKVCIVVEDEVGSGGTLVDTVNFCIAQGAVSVLALASHPVLTKPKLIHDLLDSGKLAKLVVTDTIPLTPEKEHPNIVVLSMAPHLAKAISILHEGGSLDGYKSELYSQMKLP
jgi:ribose-phosphate pyrophosphokinase